MEGKKPLLSRLEAAVLNCIVIAGFLACYLPWQEWRHEAGRIEAKAAKLRISPERCLAEVNRVVTNDLKKAVFTPKECVEHCRYLRLLEVRASDLPEVRGKDPRTLLSEHCRRQYVERNWAWAQSNTPAYFLHSNRSEGMRTFLLDRYQREAVSALEPLENRDALNPTWAGFCGFVLWWLRFWLFFAICVGPLLCLVKTATALTKWQGVAVSVRESWRQIIAVSIFPFTLGEFDPKRGYDERLHTLAYAKQGTAPFTSELWDACRSQAEEELLRSADLLVLWQGIWKQFRTDRSLPRLWRSFRQATYLTGLSVVCLLTASIRSACAETKSVIQSLNYVWQTGLTLPGLKNDHLYLFGRDGTTLAFHRAAGELKSLELTQDVVQARFGSGLGTATLGPYLEVDSSTGTTLFYGAYSFLAVKMGNWRAATPLYLYKDRKGDTLVLMPNLRVTTEVDWLGKRRVGLGAFFSQKSGDNPTLRLGPVVSQNLGDRVTLWIRVSREILGKLKGEEFVRCDLHFAF